MCILAGSVSVCFLAWSMGASAREGSANFRFNLPSTTTLGEPVIFIAKLENLTNGRMIADFGLDDKTMFVFRQTRPDGTSVRVQPQPPRNGIAFISRHLIARGTSYPAALVLDEWLDFAQLGRYQIEIEFKGSVTDAAGAEVPVNRTATLFVAVKQRDVGRLEKRCKEWLGALGQSRVNSETLYAATALSHIIDPVAIPYLEQAIELTQGSGLWRALIKIGGPDAIAAVQRLAQSANATVRAQAESVLKTIKTPASNSPRLAFGPFCRVLSRRHQAADRRYMTECSRRGRQLER